MNILRKLSDAYDSALREFDVLIMPTMPCPPVKLLSKWNEGKPLERLMRTTGVSTNTAPFNSSGHPGLSLPVGWAKAQDDEGVRLPVGMQIVGRRYEDLRVLQVAGSWERAFDWKSR